MATARVAILPAPVHAPRAELFDTVTWREWIAGHRSKQTRHNYAVDLHYTFEPYLAGRGVRSWAELRVEDIIAYPAYLREQHTPPLAAATCARKLSVVRTALRYAFVLGLVSQQILVAAELAKGAYVSDLSPRFPLGKEQVRAILRAVPTRTTKGLRDHAMLALLLYLGLRSAELASLTLGCFHRHGEYLVVQFTGKREKRRELPVRPLIAEAIRSYLAAEGRDCDLLAVPAERAGESLFRPYRVRWRKEMTTEADPAISTRGLRKLVAHYAAQAGVACDVHTLRLTAATSAIEAGATLDQVQDFLGHSDIRTTRRYVKRRQGLETSAAHFIPTYTL